MKPEPPKVYGDDGLLVPPAVAESIRANLRRRGIYRYPDPPPAYVPLTLRERIRRRLRLFRYDLAQRLHDRLFPTCPYAGDDD